MSEPDETRVNGQLFTCPACGNHMLEEVMVDVTQSANIVDVVGDAEAADPEYSATVSDGGVLDRIQCLYCGHVVVSDEDGPDLFERLTVLAKDWTQPVSEES